MRFYLDFEFRVGFPVDSNIRSKFGSEIRSRTKIGSGMEDFTVRYIVQVDEYRWVMYEDKDDITDWDAILEVRMPHEMALMLDLVQSNYWHMQAYLEAQWMLMQRMLDEDAGLVSQPVDGDQNLFSAAFEEIVKQNNLDQIAKGEEEE